LPELPEVETIRRHLSLFLPGQRVVGVLHRSPLLRLRERGMKLEHLKGWRFFRVERWGKELFLYLAGDPETGEACLRVHLGMTGRLYYLPGEALRRRASLASGAPEQPPRDRHLHLELELERGALLFWDQRRFGRLTLESGGAGREGEKGPDLWQRPPGPEEFRRRLGRARIKAALLDQRRFSGLGNIYADESLFRAGIHPLRPADRLSLEEVERLLGAVREVLAEAIAAGGTTFSDYRDGRGEPGGFGPRLRVYGREGEPCPGCRSPISRVKVGGRSAYFCPRCQS
jgi:formamidopyrimidine-DNA glycosylase